MKILSLLLFLFLLPCALPAAPIPYSGKVAINGLNFQGDAPFTFALRDANGTVHWRNGADADSGVTLNVDRGLYVCLLGGHTMNDFPPNLFLENPELFLVVHFFRLDTGQWLHLHPDQRITSAPHALAADVARNALTADAVKPGAITKSMLAADVLADLNATVVLPEQNATIQTGSITRSMLAPGVLSDLNATIAPGSITAGQLAPALLADLNRSVVISRSMLPASVLADLNGTIPRSRLSAGVLADLNRTIAITRDMLPGDVLADLNKTITRNMLPADVLADLNATPIQSGSITAGMLAPGLLADLNASAPAGDGNGTTIGAAPAGSLIAVQAGQSAPSGYSLYQPGTPKTLVWEEKAPVSVARLAGDGVEVLGGKIYFVGGWNPASNIAERYDPATNQWETLTPMSVVRAASSAAVLNGKFYAIGGQDLSSVEVYDPQTGQWSAGPALPSEVNHGTAITVGGKILLVGGRNSAGQNVNQVLEFDPSSNQWSQNAAMPTARSGHKLVLLEGKVWAIGGSSGSYTKKVEIYDPVADTWTTGTSLTTGRNWPSAWVANGRIYAAGGHSPSYLNSIESYNPATSQWSIAGSLPENKGVADAAVLDDKVYVVAGDNGSGHSNKVYAADLNASVAGVFDLYRRDGNASTSGGSGSAASIAAGSITTAQLNESILKYLRPEITTSPQALGLVFGGQTVTLSSQAEGKYLTYQWNRNGQPVAGATGATLVIADVNGTLHDGNYTLVVSNDFGSVTSSPTGLQVDATPTNHTVASIGLQMIFCPPGTFTMGSPSSETGREVDETQHQVTLTNGFYLGKYELTQAQYETVMNGNSEGLNAKPSNWPNNDDRPVERVSWNDAQVFLLRLNSIEQTAGRLPAGWKYVLPTEAEWEYACRAGTTTAYSWGNDVNSSHANWNYGNDANQTVNFGQYAANSWGFFDMSGNVAEWVFDWKANYPGGVQTNPEGPASGSNRLVRGGSWAGGDIGLRSARRNAGPPDGRHKTFGFRVGFKAISADEANPELELFGGAGITREAGQPWAEPGVAAHDARDGNLTASVTVSGTVDVNSTGTYVLTYTVADAAGNEVNATRTVTVSDTTDPVVTLLGDANVTHAKGAAWVEPGATASDTLDGNLTNQVTVTGTVDVNSSGAYVLTYSVSDAAGNDSNVTRVVNVGMATTRVVDLNASVAMQMLWVEPGTFTMGSPTSEAGRLTNEAEHNVTLTKGFYLGKYEVTQAQYQAVMTGNSNSLSATPSEWPNNPNRPVEKVSRDDAQIFLTRLNAAEQAAGRLPSGWSYVLPTESEWEYACRAGTTTAYSWGATFAASNANYSGSGISQTRDVGQYAANPWGFFDMHGNVWEWTADRYQAAYPTGNLTDPTGPASGSSRVVRGGSWSNGGAGLRSAKRLNYLRGNRLNSLGFRVGFKFTGEHSVDLNASVAMQMLWVEPGTFTMGSPTSEAGRESNEVEHNVTLTNGFYLGKYEVTQAQYEAVMTGNTNSLSATPSQYSGNDRPVEKVSWNDAQVFLTRLNAAEQSAGRLPAGWSYVLPTEAEWEYACRAGTTTVYSWGNSIATTNANYNDNIGQTRDVGQYAANPWGFYDMHGNVREWVNDRYQTAYPTGNLTDPTGPASGSSRTFRDGSWYNPGSHLRSAKRSNYNPDNRTTDLGFRVGYKFTGEHSVDLNATVAMEMLWVEPGTFTMGSPTNEPDRNADREDEHNVTLTKGFYLGKYEVTQAQYEAVMTGNSNSLSATPSEWPGNPNRPVEKVSWDDAQIFLTRLNAAEQAADRLPAGWSYVLPTESEWEYACRAGTTTAYSWGNDINASHANWNHGADPNQTVNVGQYAANPWGFFDMHGNVWEWTADRYQAAYPTGNVTDPTGPASGTNRVRRGGSWATGGTSLRSARRFDYAPGNRPNHLGFRVGFKASQ